MQQRDYAGLKGRSAQNGLTNITRSEDAEVLKTEAMCRLLDEAQKGWDSAQKEGWLSLDEASELLKSI